MSGAGKKRVDEDWKRQGQAQAKQEEKTGGGERGPGGAAIDFSAFVSSLGVQALVQLGQIPDQATGKAEVDLVQARRTISLIEMLRDKTLGNLDEQELKLMDETLYGLHTSFVAVSKAQGLS